MPKNVRLFKRNSHNYVLNLDELFPFVKHASKEIPNLIAQENARSSIVILKLRLLTHVVQLGSVRQLEHLAAGV